VQADPDWSELPARTPDSIRRLLRRCLERDRKKRLPEIGAARLEIEDALAPVENVPEPRRPKTRAPIAAAAVLAVLAAVSGVGWWRAARPGQAALQPFVRLDVDLGSNVALGASPGFDFVLSPDGMRMAYISRLRLFMRRLDQASATELAGMEMAYLPFFSPDGQWVGFFSGTGLKKISVNGGAEVTLCNTASGWGASWGTDGNIIASIGGVLSRLPSTGGMPARIAELEQGEVSHRWPQILPGAKAVLFTAYRGNFDPDEGSIEVLSLSDRRRKTLHRSGTFGRYLPSGHIVYLNRGTLFGAAFDLDRLEMRGAPTPVLGEQVYTTSSTGAGQFDFPTAVNGPGMLVYKSGAALRPVTVQRMDGEGRMQPLLAKSGEYRELRAVLTGRQPYHPDFQR
jgi:serine/threonine-protein kinase